VGVIAQGPVESGPCPRPINNCFSFRVTGSFSVAGNLRAVAPGVAPALSIPVAAVGGSASGTRSISCQPATTDGIAACNGTVPDRGLIPHVGGTVVATVAAFTATPTATSTATLTATPTSTPTATVTAAPTSLVGQTFHTLIPAVSLASSPIFQGPILAGPCPAASVGCVQLTVTGSFLVSGTIPGLPLGLTPTLTIPVATTAGVPAGTRAVPCSSADASGTSRCNSLVPDPGIVPLVGGTLTISGVPGTPTPLPVAGPGTVVAAPLPLLPPPLPLVLPPPPPPLVMPLPAAPAPAGEVPLIPEADSAWFLLAGLMGVAAVVYWRRR
jgi:hypothetical protein